MDALRGERARELGRVALRFAGAGVFGTAIGVVAKRFPVAAQPVWETARHLRDALPTLPTVTLPSLPSPPSMSPEMVPVVALFVLALGLAAVAGFLWTRASSSSVDAARAPRLDVAALTARFRRPAQRRADPQRAGLVPTLAATGIDRAEIARRTGLSRDAVALSLNLAARQV